MAQKQLMHNKAIRNMKILALIFALSMATYSASASKASVFFANGNNLQDTIKQPNDSINKVINEVL